MSKGEGKKIAIKFTEELVGDVTGYIPKPIAVSEYIKPLGIATASSQYSSYSPDRVFDGDENSYWYTRTAGDQWVQIELTKEEYIAGFKWYIGSSYRPNGFIVLGSNDGLNWDNIYTGTSENVTGWQEFTFSMTDITYKFIRWTITSRHSSYLNIYEIKIKTGIGQEGAFTVTGKEFKYVGGPLLDREYKPISVELHPSIINSILLSFPHFGEFNDVVGDITVNYDSSLGNLFGRGGAVESFLTTFTPTELIATPDPNVIERITIAPTEVMADMKKVTYENRFIKEYISIAPTEITATLLKVSEVNP